MIKRNGRESRSNVAGFFAFISRILELYVLPFWLAAMSFGITYFGLSSRLWTAGELLEFRGRLSSYYFQQSGRSPDSYHTDLVLENNRRFWTYAVDKKNAAQVFTAAHPEIRLFVPPEPFVASDGALYAYGLWVDGRMIRSVEDDLTSEYYSKRFGFPALGLLLGALAVILYLHPRRRSAVRP